MQGYNYLKSETIPELKRDLNHPEAQVLAGGTDIVPKMRQGLFSAPILVDTSKVKSLNFIEDMGNKMVIGALTSQQSLVDSTLIRNVIPTLAAAVEDISDV